MKKAIFGILLLIGLNAKAQDKEKKDTTIQLTMTLHQYRILLFKIESNIDSKIATKEIFDFLQKTAQMVADKPKEQIKLKQ